MRRLGTARATLLVFQGFLRLAQERKDHHQLLLHLAAAGVHAVGLKVMRVGFLVLPGLKGHVAFEHHGTEGFGRGGG